MIFVCPLMVVKDIAVSVRFYQELFDLSVEYDFGENVSFAGGPALQSLESFVKMMTVSDDTVICRPHNMELYFEEEEFDAFAVSLAAMKEIRYLHGVLEQPWGQRVVRIYDPNFHIIEIGESMVVVIRRCLANGMSVAETAAKTQHTRSRWLNGLHPETDYFSMRLALSAAQRVRMRNSSPGSGLFLSASL